MIGAGASAKTDKDWSGLWNESDEAKRVQEQIDKFHDEKKNKASQADESPDSGRGYAAPMFVQFGIVLKRVFQHYNRDPTYVLAKLMLNIVAGLFIGFRSARAHTPFPQTEADIPPLQFLDVAARPDGHAELPVRRLHGGRPVGAALAAAPAQVPRPPHALRRP